jgi:hypothetical protein
MPDDMLRDAIETSRRVLDNINDFDTEGDFLSFSLSPYLISRSAMRGNNKK